MKMKTIYKVLGLLAVSAGISSCSSDYLDQPPITSLTDYQVGESIEAARAALYGTCQAMYNGFYQDNNDRSNSGEAWFQTYYGDSGSPDFWDSLLYGYQSELQLWNLMLRNTFWASQNAWMYGYNIIGQANSILAVIDNVPADKNEIDFVKAQCLTLRAHACIRLMQVYGPRYEDSDGGKAYCIILRSEPGTDPLPLSSYADCMEYIYKDLNQAISLFEGSTVQRKYGYEPDINIAKGLYSRIALLNHDWQLAAQMAKEARQFYPIMSADEYLEGFADANGEWLWYNDMDNSYVGYASWGASYACNGWYATAYNWSGAGCISFKLYDQIYERYPNDVRCELFWTPDKGNKYVELGIKREDFWNPQMVNTEYGYMWGPKMNQNISAAISLFAAHMNPAPSYFTESAFGVNTELTDDMAKSVTGRKRWFDNLPSSSINTCQPGAQLKFWSYPSLTYASSHPFMRSAELLLNEAEAQMELGNESAARELLIELNENRIENYSCTLSGTELRDEIRLYRRMELWGEGDTWFSFKRWNLGVTRTAWKANDPESDTFLSAYEGSWGPEWGNGWRFRIPTTETNYNPLVADQLNE